MIQEYAQEFLNRLRSGKYTQTFYNLKTTHNGAECYCALGILQEIMIQQYPLNYTNRNLLPDWISDVVELDPNLRRAIFEWNDTDRLTFPQIADKIEEWLNADSQIRR